jgi:hypothetical protein
MKSKPEINTFTTALRENKTQDKTKRSTEWNDVKKSDLLENQTELGFNNNAINNLSYTYINASGDNSIYKFNQNNTMHLSKNNSKSNFKTYVDKATVDKSEPRPKTSRNSRPVSPKSSNYTKQLDMLNKLLSQQAQTTKCRSPAERLHDDSIIIKAKLKGKRLESEIEIRKNMTPTISKRSQGLQRDPQLFCERLYPYHKIQKKEGIRKCSSSHSSLFEDFTNGKQNLRDLYGTKSLVNIYRKTKENQFDDFDFKPKISKKSQDIS